MKANITNLKKVLKLCAKAHNCEFMDWSDDGQLALKSETPGTVCDVRMIVESFYGEADVETGFGYTTVWLYEESDRDVDMDLLKMALPYGTKLN